ncbi:hypothetical protein PINS_up010339 [Pythium insidiosum]|nr:hypothetical protein PINS_up010339 [Pythium insidiosum]
MAFSAEYLLRCWACVEDDRFATPVWGRLKWMCRPMSVIDLVVLIPFYLEIVLQHGLLPGSRGFVSLRGLRLLRIMSFLRLERSYKAMKRLRAIFCCKCEELWVVSYLTAVMVLTASTTIFFLENTTQPEVFSSIWVCAWWSIETITSLGYGDIVPVTSGGRVFASILAVWGIVLFTIPGAVLSSGFVEVMLEKQERDKKEFQEELTLSLSRRITGIQRNKYQPAPPAYM